MKKISVQIASDIVVDYLADYIKPATDVSIDCSVAPYGQIMQVLLGEPQAQNLILWTSPEKQIQSFERYLHFDQVDMAEIANEVSGFAKKVRSAAENYDNVFFVNWNIPSDAAWPVGLMMKPGVGAGNILAKMNIQLGDELSDVSNFHVVDLNQILSEYHGNPRDPRLKAMARMPYTPDFLEHFGKLLTPAIVSSVVSSRKVIFCDLDNTLWGGIVGDDGVGGLRVGGNDPIGASHLNVQTVLKALNNRGILLALSSKNTEEVAIDAIQRHPNMVLSVDDFSAHRINWSDKAANISEMLKELNLFPSAAVFLDDNVSERERVKAALPDVLVPDLPEDVSYWPDIISKLNCFETLTVSKEDLARSESYKMERLRRESQSVSLDLEEWLSSLDLVVQCEALNRDNLARAVQLLNKTNQFNIHTRRFGEEEFWNWCQSKDRHCYTYSVSDKFGSSGLTGVVSLEKAAGGWKFSDFVLSCRVMGKGVEDALVAHALAAVDGSAPVQLSFTQTAKNGPAQKFVERVTEGSVVQPGFPAPKHISIREV